MMALWDLGWRLYPAIALIAVGGLLTLRGGWLGWESARTPIERPGKNLTWMRGFRKSVQGLALVALAAGWAWHVPAIVAAALVIGFEETLETSIAIWALRQEEQLERTASHHG